MPRWEDTIVAVLVFELENGGYAARGGEERTEEIAERFLVVLPLRLLGFSHHVRKEECCLARLAPRVRWEWRRVVHNGRIYPPDVAMGLRGNNQPGTAPTADPRLL
jgi:hypothetical protein